MTKPTKYFYAFIGELRATHGRPHAITGRLSTYGDLVHFSNKSHRDFFVKCTQVNSPDKSIVNTNLSAAKTEFFGGLTQLQFNEYVKEVNAGFISTARYTC